MYSISLNGNHYCQIRSFENNSSKIVDEEKNLFKRELVLIQKELELNIQDSEGNKTLYLQTPKYNLYTQSLVFDNSHKAIGHIKEVFSFINKKYKLYLDDKTTIIIKGSPKCFKIYKDKKEIGRVKFNGNNIDITLNDDIQSLDILLTLILHIDITYMQSNKIRRLIKRSFLLGFLAVFLIYFTLLLSKAYAVYTLSDDLELDENIGMDMNITNIPILEAKNLEYNKELLELIKNTYNNKLYDNFHPMKLFDESETMLQEKQDFYKILPLYLEEEKLFVFKNDELFSSLIMKDGNNIRSLLQHFNLLYFYDSLISYIKYLDKQKKYEKADEIFIKLVNSLNSFMINSYHFDYVYALVYNRNIFYQLDCNDRRKEFLNDNNQMLEKIFLKRLGSEPMHLTQSFIVGVKGNPEFEELKKDVSEKQWNRIMQIRKELISKQVTILIKMFKNNELDKIEEVEDLASFITFELISIALFNHNDRYFENFMAYSFFTFDMISLRRHYLKMYQIIRKKEVFLKGCYK